ncbi:helix-turn-helix transcriptional regulator [uncultured Sneathiella sp.]|jgi:transcriptional regulator with XRE-family HTH domain|uniref:helix-turn-helix domain-containing protein n=1 Tax=uncultured Sneathiella sp. TaxID=879315 RepID=UPI0030EF51E0|tara:strand:+ start:52 stop:522 length:471 start_codon:yes stop_codon:yes gene_type:complete
MTSKEKPTRNTPGRGRGRTVDGQPNPIDIHVGVRLRLRRTLMGMTQEKLGASVGLTFQQIQKYERGANRIGASRLYDLSHVLEVPLSFFFDDMPEEISGKTPLGRISEKSDYRPDDDDLNRRETLELVRAYYRISNPQVRKKVFDLVKSLGEATAS